MPRRSRLRWHPIDGTYRHSSRVKLATYHHLPSFFSAHPSISFPPRSQLALWLLHPQRARMLSACKRSTAGCEDKPGYDWQKGRDPPSATVSEGHIPTGLQEDVGHTSALAIWLLQNVPSLKKQPSHLLLDRSRYRIFPSYRSSPRARRGIPLSTPKKEAPRTVEQDASVLVASTTGSAPSTPAGDARNPTPAASHTPCPGVTEAEDDSENVTIWKVSRRSARMVAVLDM